MKNIFDKFGCATAILAAGAVAASAGNDQWVIHEWGTFTSLQDESGRATGGINTDDEELPSFCHQLSRRVLQSPDGKPKYFNKGLVQCHPDVTMRLETPVLYFHPPHSGIQTQEPTVTATFHGGWLTEFYPNATAIAPGFYNGLGPLSSDSVGTLTWGNLEVGGEWTGPATAEHVWTSPRAVQAAPVRTGAGEAEKFLFYRGVGHIAAPLSVSRDEERQELVLRSQLDSHVVGNQALPVRSLWLVDIQADGRVAFRSLPPVSLGGGAQELARTPSGFKLSDYDPANLEKLKTSLRDALEAEGLFCDEAQALLNTWEVSYFKSAGTRLFFIVPRAWTDSYLTLRVSVPAEIDRVMVDRIELVTPSQRRALQEIAQAPADKGQQLYDGLGRFRNALLLDEVARRPSAGLRAFNLAHSVSALKPMALWQRTLLTAAAYFQNP